MEEVRMHQEQRTGKFSMKSAVSMIMLCMCEIIYKTCVTQLLIMKLNWFAEVLLATLIKCISSSIALIALAFNSPQQSLV